MEKSLFPLFSALNLIAIAYGIAENIDDDKTYDLSRFIQKHVGRYENSLRAEQHGVLSRFKLGGIDEEWKFEPSGDLNFSKCLDDMVYLLENIRSPWAMKLIDSYGKPESGILNGNFRWLGDYNECVGVRVSNPDSNSTAGNFRGKYCSLTWSLKPLGVNLPFQFTSGVCIPDSCSASEFQQYTLQLLHMAGVLPAFNDSNSTLNSDALQCKPTERHLSGAAKAVIALLSIFCALTVLGSSVTIVKNFKRIVEEPKTTSYAGKIHINNEFNGDKNNMSNKESVPAEALIQDGVAVAIKGSHRRDKEAFLSCFCVFTNGAKLLNTCTSESELLCIHGIRFLSLSWVILGHSYIYGHAQIKNMVEVIPMLNSFPFQAIRQAPYSVDSFFILSAFLLTFQFMKEYSKTKGNISWPYFYIHRYLRLTPMYMIILGFSATVYLHLGSGPYWPNFDIDPSCTKTWWRNLLYINNFDVQAEQCFDHSWYLANDMQFFIISPLFLITLWRWPKIGFFLLAIFLLASFLCSFLITYHFDLSDGIFTIFTNGINNMENAEKEFSAYFEKLVSKPYTRIGPYLMGMLTGYIFFKRKATNAPKHSRVFLIVGWIIASSVTLATVYGLYRAHPGLLVRSFYNAISRICWSVGLCWVIYVCLIGQGGFINRLLSFKFFIPLSRLTYATYLIHPMIIQGYLMNLKSSLEFSHPTIVILFLGFMVVTYALSLPVTLILESPLVGLEKLIRKMFTTEKKTETKIEVGQSASLPVLADQNTPL